MLSMLHPGLSWGKSRGERVVKDRGFLTMTSPDCAPSARAQTFVSPVLWPREAKG